MKKQTTKLYQILRIDRIDSSVSYGLTFTSTDEAEAREELKKRLQEHMKVQGGPLTRAARRVRFRQPPGSRWQLHVEEWVPGIEQCIAKVYPCQTCGLLRFQCPSGDFVVAGAYPQAVLRAGIKKLCEACYNKQCEELSIKCTCGETVMPGRYEAHKATKSCKYKSKCHEMKAAGYVHVDFGKKGLIDRNFLPFRIEDTGTSSYSPHFSPQIWVSKPIAMMLSARGKVRLQLLAKYKANPNEVEFGLRMGRPFEELIKE